MEQGTVTITVTTTTTTTTLLNTQVNAAMGRRRSSTGGGERVIPIKIEGRSEVSVCPYVCTGWPKINTTNTGWSRISPSPGRKTDKLHNLTALWRFFSKLMH